MSLNTTERDAVYEPLAQEYPSWSEQLPADGLMPNTVITGIMPLSLQTCLGQKGIYRPDGIIITKEAYAEKTFIVPFFTKPWYTVKPSPPRPG